MIIHKCNQCDRSQPNALPLKIERVEQLQIISITTPPELVEFCTWKCLGEYATKKSSVE